LGSLQHERSAGKVLPLVDIFDLLATQIDDEAAIKTIKSTNLAKTLAHEIITISEDRIAELIAAGLVMYLRKRGMMRLALRSLKALGLGTLLRMVGDFLYGVSIGDVLAVVGTLRPPNKARISRGRIVTLEYTNPLMNRQTKTQEIY
jgi:hypothetical protein